MAESPKLPLKLMNVTDKNIDRVISIIVAEKNATHVMLDSTCQLNAESLNKIRQHGITIIPSITPENRNKIGIFFLKDLLPTSYIPEESPEGPCEVINAELLMKNNP